MAGGFFVYGGFMPKWLRWTLYIVVPVVALFAGCLGGVAIGGASGSTTTAAARPASTVTSTVTAEPTAAPTVTVPGPAVTVTASAATVPTPTVTVTVAAPAAAAPAAGGATIPGDGTYLVGSDIQPGTYKASPADDSCYWARLKDTAGGLGSIAANHIGAGSQVVTIRSGDAAFETTRCGSWTKQ